MLGRPEERDVRVVVEQGQVVTPADVQREPRAEADAERGSQALRPQRRPSQRRIALPVELAHPAGHFAIAGKDLRWGARGRHWTPMFCLYSPASTVIDSITLRMRTRPE